MGKNAALSLLLLTVILGCRDKSAFKAGVSERTITKTQDAAPAASSPTPASPVDINSSVPSESSQLPSVNIPAAQAPKEIVLTLEVKVSAPEVRAGKKPIQAEAILSVPSPTAKILWSLEGPAGIDLGSIDATGKYLSPNKAEKELIVTIVATLESNPKVIGEKKIKVIPVEQLFVGCKKGNLTFPITAEVFKIADTTSRLPDFSKLMRDDIVCLDKYDIPLQSWEVGFPGSPHLQEWFALHSKAKLNIQTPGIYEFRLYSDDGAKFYINGAIIVDNDGTHSALAKEGSVSLTAGVQNIVLDYYQGPRTQVALQLFWKVPGSNQFVIVPASVFSAN